jgi:MoxR-like ATPase
MSTNPSTETQAAQRLTDAYRSIRAELGKQIIGMDRVIEELMICIFSRGHCLLVGVPGLAKTLLISSLARTLSLSFARIQFTPDLMPADITGTEVIQEDKGTGERSFKFLRGPIFANVILADEINRTPPKTQAALLEAMQEHQVTAGGEKFPLDEPFFVLATQNPIEQEGTYPLPEAQQDRFMFNVKVDYPSRDEEIDIMKLTTAQAAPVLDSDRGPGPAVRGAPRARDAPRLRGRARLHQGVARLGRRPPRDPEPHPRRQGAGAAGRPLLRVDRRHTGGGAPGLPAPSHHQLQRRSRGCHLRQAGRPAAGDDPP